MTLLNTFERLIVNNPGRALLQRYGEARWLIENGGLIPGKRALEIGCGRGVGAQIIFDTFGARTLDAFDLDPKMLITARKRLTRYQGRLRLFVGDATKIDAPDASYDAVFDFGIIHHIPNWRDAIKEVQRVLAPGGRFYASEVLHDFIMHPLWRRLFDHPMEDRFDTNTFAQELTNNGLQVVATKDFFQNFALFVAERPN